MMELLWPRYAEPVIKYTLDKWEFQTEPANKNILLGMRGLCWLLNYYLNILRPITQIPLFYLRPKTLLLLTQTKHYSLIKNGSSKLILSAIKIRFTNCRSDFFFVKLESSWRVLYNSFDKRQFSKNWADLCYCLSAGPLRTCGAQLCLLDALLVPQLVQFLRLYKWCD